MVVVKCTQTRTDGDCIRVHFPVDAICSTSISGRFGSQRMMPGPITNCRTFRRCRSLRPRFGAPETAFAIPLLAVAMPICSPVFDSELAKGLRSIDLESIICTDVSLSHPIHSNERDHVWRTGRF